MSAITAIFWQSTCCAMHPSEGRAKLARYSCSRRSRSGRESNHHGRFVTMTINLVASDEDLATALNVLQRPAVPRTESWALCTSRLPSFGNSKHDQVTRTLSTLIATDIGNSFVDRGIGGHCQADCRKDETWGRLLLLYIDVISQNIAQLCSASYCT